MLNHIQIINSLKRKIKKKEIQKTQRALLFSFVFLRCIEKQQNMQLKFELFIFLPVAAATEVLFYLYSSSSTNDTK